MDKKKILIVCRAFYPENSPRSFRATELVKEFARQGHDVTVLTNERAFDYSEFLSEYPIAIKSFGKLKWKNLTPTKLLGDLPRKFGRLLSMLFEYPNIEVMFRLKMALESEKNYDLMISIAVPYSIHWGVAWSRSNNHRIASTWVADCGDPFMGNILESFRYPFYLGWLEKWFSRKADFITIPVQSAISGYYKEFHSKIRIIPQGFEFIGLPLKNDFQNNEIVEFAYAGGVSSMGVRSPLKLIEYLLTLDKDFRFHIFSTTGKDFLYSYIQKSNGRIILHDAISRNELLLFLSKMDFLINLSNGTSMQVPSKLIDYGLTRRPVLNISPLNPNRNLVDEFLCRNYKAALKVQNIDQYNIKNVASKFIALTMNVQ